MLRDVRPAHLSRLRVPGRQIEDLVFLHAEWALGLGRFESLRAERLAAGVDPTLDAASVAGDRLKVTLPEAGGSMRISVVRIGAAEGAVLVDHLVVRQGPESLLRYPAAAAPEVVHHLLSIQGVLADLDRADGRPNRVGEQHVGQLVARILSAERSLPIVLVSVDNATRDPLLDPQELAQRLAGMASVFFLGTVAASRELKNELLARGFSEKYGCYNGGVRILWPAIGPQDDPYDHLLLLPARLLGVPGHRRAEHVAGLFCEMIAEDEDLRAWLREIEPPRPPPPPPEIPLAASGWRSPLADAASRPQAVAGPATTPEALAVAATQPAREAWSSAEAEPEAMPQPEARPELPRASEPSPQPAATLHATEPASAPPDSQPEAAEVPTEPARIEPPARLETQWSRVANDVVAALDLAAELEAELESTRRELNQTKRALRRAEQERDEALGTVGTIPSVAAALVRAADLFPERLLVCKSAHGSAEDSPFKHPGKVFEVLALLALFGRQDREVDRSLTLALGNVAEWKPKDSPETTSKFGADRTFVASDGKPKLFKRHVTIGGSKNTTRCLQIYYDVLADGRVEIGWCGEHRPTVGMDS